MQHLDEILSLMEEHFLLAKEFECEFGLTEILYLGHVIGAEGVKVHQEKIQAILDWPPPRDVTELRGFLHLCSYYRRSAKGFSQVVAPLTNQSQKGAFRWTEDSEAAFDRLKQVMRTLVLALLDFSRPFVLECDTSGSGIEAVLM